MKYNQSKIIKINEPTFSGDSVVIKEVNLKMKWKGSKITLEMLDEIKAYFLWTFNVHQKEAGVKLYYSDVEKEWLVFVPYQNNSMYGVKEEDKRTLKARTIEIPSGYSLLGTMHHHSNINAFHSSTDIEDEREVNGIHITFGNLDTPTWTYDAKVVFNKTFYHCNLKQWFDFPKLPKKLNKYNESFCHHLFSTALNLPDTFNESWKERIEPEKVIRNTYYDNPYNDIDGRYIINGNSKNISIDPNLFAKQENNQYIYNDIDKFPTKTKKAEPDFDEYDENELSPKARYVIASVINHLCEQFDITDNEIKEAFIIH